MADVLNFGITWKTAQSYNLLELVNDTSSFLKIELGNVAKEKGDITNIRGMGTYIGFDVNGDTDNMMRWLMKRGVLVAKTGPNTIGLRPALILGPTQAANLREALKYYDPAHD